MGIIRKRIARAAKLFKKIGFADAVLTRKTPGSRQVGNPAAGMQPTSTTYRCIAMIEKRLRFKSGTLVQEGMSLLSIIGGKIAVMPMAGDTVVLRGTTYRVFRVEADSDEAMYECEVSH